MNKKNSGMTIVEIIISLAIISIVIVLLFALLMSVRNEDASNAVKSNFVINQSSFIKAIEEDLVNYGVKSIAPCTLADANISSTVASGYEDKYKCVRIVYSADYITDKIGFLLIYRYYTKYNRVGNNYVGTESEWMIQYIRGSYTKCPAGREPTKSSWQNKTMLMKEIPDDIDLDEVPYILYTSLPSSVNAASIVVPIVTMDNDHYDINLSFTFNGNANFACDRYDAKKLKCNCQSTAALCNNTYRNPNVCS